MQLSVITICYNEKNIERTLKSIVGQSCRDFEWIVIDGGSTDGTLEIIKRYKNDIDILVSETDKGIYNAMNKGIKMAKGKYLNFMNGGDEFVDEKVIEEFYAFAGQFDEEDVIYGNFNLIAPDGKISDISFPCCINRTFFYDNTINHQSAFIKRELFDKFGLYDENYKIAADWAKWCIFANHHCRFKHWERKIAKFYADGISATQKDRLNAEKEIIQNTFYQKEERMAIKKQFFCQYIVLLFGKMPLLTISDKRAGYVRKYKLLGIPVYKTVHKKDIWKHYLFGVILLFSIKEHTK